HRDDQVGALAVVLAAEVIAQHSVVARILELGDVQRLAVELDAVLHLALEHLPQAAIDQRQAGQVLFLVEDEKHVLARLREPRRQTCSESQREEQRGAAVTKSDRLCHVSDHTTGSSDRDVHALPLARRSLRFYALGSSDWRQAMIKVSVMYPNTPGARFDHAYYRDKHMPLVKARMGDSCLYYTIDK